MKTFTHYLNLDDTENYQLVYTSQIYGTFFAVYAKFNIDPEQSNLEPGEGEKKSYFVKSIDFEVINYKGLLNLGIVNVGMPAEYMDQVNQRLSQQNQNTVKVFNLVMRGIGGLDTDGDDQLKPVKSKNKDLNMEITSTDVLYFRRTTERLHFDGREEAQGMFDEEFYYREGLPPYKEKSRIPEEIMPDLASINFRTKSGPLCPESKVWVI